MLPDRQRHVMRLPTRDHETSRPSNALPFYDFLVYRTVTLHVPDRRDRPAR